MAKKPSQYANDSLLAPTPIGADRSTRQPISQYADDSLLSPRATDREKSGGNFDWPEFLVQQWELAAQMAGRRSLLEAPDDRTLTEEFGVGLRRGAFAVSKQIGGLQMMAASQSERIMQGEKNFMTRFLDLHGRFLVAGAELKQAETPRSDDEYWTARKFAGDFGELLPPFLIQAFAGFGTGGSSLPIQTLMFAGVASGQVVGDQYITTLRETGDPNQAAIEAGAAGLITFATSKIEGGFIFKGAGKDFVGQAALRVAADFAVGGTAESVQEMADKVLREAAIVALRDDLTFAKDAYRREPEFFTALMWEGLLAFGAGGPITAVGRPVAGRIERAYKKGEAARLEDLQKVHDALRATMTPDALEAALKNRQKRREAAERRESLTGLKPPVDVTEPPAAAERPASRFSDAERAEAEALARSMIREPLATPTEKARARALLDDIKKAAAERQAAAAVVTPKPPVTKPTETTQEKFNRFVFDEPPKTDDADLRETETISEAEEIRRELIERNRAAREAIKSERAKTDAKWKQRISDLRRKLLDKTADIEDIRKSLINAVRDRLKGDIPQVLARAMGTIRTDAALSRALRRVNAEVEKRERAEAVADLVKAIRKIKDPKRLKPEVRSVIEEILRDIQLHGLSKAAKLDAEKIRAFLSSSPDTRVPERLEKHLKRLDRIPVKDLTAAEARDLTNLITGLLDRNRRWQIQRKKTRAQQRNTDAIKIAAEIEAANLTDAGVDLVSGRQQPERRQAIVRLARLPFDAINVMTLSTLSEVISAGGTRARAITHTMKVLYHNLADAQVLMLNGYKAAHDALEGWVNDSQIGWGSETLASMSPTFAGQTNPIRRAMEAMGLEVTGAVLKGDHDEATIKLENGQTLVIAPTERMYLAAALRDRRFFDNVILGDTPIFMRDRAEGRQIYHLTLGDATNIVDSMTEQESALVNLMVDYINTTLKDVVRVWSVNQLGRDITNPDTYWMIHRELQKGDKLETDVSAFVRQTMESSGYVAERTSRANQPIQIRDIFVEFLNHAMTVNAVAYVAPEMRRARAALDDGRVSGQLKSKKHWKLVRQRFEDTFNQMVTDFIGGSSLRGPADQIAGALLGNISRAALGLNPKVAAKQIVSIILAMPIIAPTFVWQAVTEGAMWDTRIDGRIRANSSYLWFRASESLLGLINEGSDRGTASLGFKSPGHISMFLIRMMDNAAIRGIWRAAELQAEHQSREALETTGAAMTPEQIMERASKIAHQVVAETQPTFDTLHTSWSGVLGKGNAWYKSFGLFRAQRVKLQDMAYRDWMRAQRDPQYRAMHMGWMGVRLASNAVGIGSVTVLFNAVERLLGVRDDDRDEDKRIRAAMAEYVGTIAGIPLFGEFAIPPIRMALGLRTPFEPSNPIYDTFNKITRNIHRFVGSLQDDEAFDIVAAGIGFAESIYSAFGVPTTPLRYLRNLIEEEE